MGCLKSSAQLRTFQMEKAIVRSTLDSSIMMNVTVPENQFVFTKDFIDKYIYECKEENKHFYVYSLLELLCFQCGFFTWDEIRK